MSYHTRAGFSLIELSIAMTVMAILATAIVPVAVKAVEIKAAEKTALEIATIQEAARNYFTVKAVWPSNFTDLQTQGYLDPNWVLVNPWKNPYAFTVTSSLFKVETNVPLNLTQMVAAHLPASVVSNTLVSSSITAPGSQAIVEHGVIVAWSGSIADIPAGWVLCDGNNGTPDLQDKFIVGARQDEDGVAKTNIMGTLNQTGGAISHNHGGQTGSHVLTIEEIPPHSHGIHNSDGGGGGGGDLTNLQKTDNTNHGGIATDLTGGGLGHTHAISSDFNVPPFYALAFIMKL